MAASHHLNDPTVVFLDGEGLNCDELVKLGNGGCHIRLKYEALMNVDKAHAVVENIISEGRSVYGVTTGFGKFSQIPIFGEGQKMVQYNLIRSHSVGVGERLPLHRVRMLMALRINVLTRGHSGVTKRTLEKFVDAFNADVLPEVPCKGSVGASGDLAPLAHLALGLLGEGRAWSPKTGYTDAAIALQTYGLTPLQLGPKDGLSLINGTQFITALGAEAAFRGALLAKQATVIGALSLEGLEGLTAAFDSRVHRARPHVGQQVVAAQLRALLHSNLHPSAIAQSHGELHRVQDCYSLRCMPQVHGVVYDTIGFVKGILDVEINSTTDNPIVFDMESIISAGNFHGEYPAKALDYLAISIHELSSISERRIERLVNSAHSDLPMFLTPQGGLNSGFMMAHCTAAALVSENKTLCHPASVDSIPTSAGQEDHVSMGAWASRKALEVADNVENVLAIELLAACQAIDFRRPLTTTAPLEKVHKLVRSVVPRLETDRALHVDIDAVAALIRKGEVWHIVKEDIQQYLQREPAMKFATQSC